MAKITTYNPQTSQQTAPYDADKFNVQDGIEIKTVVDANDDEFQELSGRTTGTNTGDETQSSIITKIGFTPYNVTNPAGYITLSAVTKSQVGLANVDNTSDANKPVSTAQATAIALKVDKTTTVNSKPLSGNITLDKIDVGLGNVDNTSDVNKPVSTAQSTALGLKADTSALTAYATKTGAETLTNKTITAPLGIVPADLGLVKATATEISNETQINLIGDSFIDLSPTWLSPVQQFQTATGLKSNNLGVSGNTTTQILARFNLQPASLLQQSWVFEGGRNDITFGGGYITAVSDGIKANIASMVAAIGHNRYLVMGLSPANSETAVSSGGIFVAQLNADLLAIYGTRFVPVLAALQAGGNGGTNDNADIAAGIVPRSLISVDPHLTTAGYAIYAQQIINKVALIVPNPDKYITIGALGGILQQGQLSYDLGQNGAYKIGGYQAIRIPDQVNFLNTLIIGSGGKNLSHTTGAEAQGNTIIGMGAATAMTTANGNTAIGNFALNSVTTTADNTGIGESAGLNWISSQGTFIGKSAGRNATTGQYSIFIGPGSGLGISTGNGIYMGYNSAFAGNGTGNVVIGQSALQNATGASSNNVALGTEALKSGTGVVGQSIGIGRQTGIANTGSNQIFIGDLAADNNTTGAKNLVIAHQGDVQSATASNQINIGNAIWGTGASGTGVTPAGNIGIGVIAPTARLHVAAGTVTAGTAPFKIPVGVLLTTPEAGAFEVDAAGVLYFTVGSTRKTVALV